MELKFDCKPPSKNLNLHPDCNPDYSHDLMDWSLAKDTLINVSCKSVKSGSDPDHHPDLDHNPDYPQNPWLKTDLW